jgi:predicted PurR-regulated permease PerM
MAKKSLEVLRSPRPWLRHRLDSDICDPCEAESATDLWREATQTAIVVIGVLAVGILFYVARPILFPVLAAFIVGMTFGPYVGRATRLGVPAWVMALLVVLFVVGVANLAVVVLANPISEMLRRTPKIVQAVKDKLQFFNRPILAFYHLRAAFGSVEEIGFDAAHVIEGAIKVVTPAAVQLLLQLVLFVGTLFFFVLGRSSFRDHTVRWFSTRDARLRALKIINDIEENLSGYLVLVTIINFCLGLATVAVAYLLELPFPLLWGALAFGLNYLPYIGPGFVCVLLFLVGLLTYPTLPGALLPSAIFLTITTIEGQFLTPAIVGRRILQVNPLVVFLAIAFWAWLWGPPGAFMAIPFLIIFRSAIEHLYPWQKGELPD